MVQVKIPFLKGHMGGNEIVLLWKGIPKNKVLEVGEKVLKSPFNLADELGIVYKTEKENRLKIKMLWKYCDDFIAMCGGVTQVLGNALVDVPEFANDCNIVFKAPVTRILLETAVGLIPIDIEPEKNKVTTDMTYYVKECYRVGVQSVKVAGVNAMKVGEYLVAESGDIKKRYPQVNIETMDKETLNVLVRIQKDWFNKNYSGTGFAIYDLNPNHNGDFRAVYPHKVDAGDIEPTCGTGTVALGIAIMEKKKKLSVDITPQFRFETGGEPVLGGPDISELKMVFNGEVVEKALFSHNLIETLISGIICIQVED